jgi:NTP pyrophosphatase (non-canonical NTP hydrolase)
LSKLLQEYERQVAGGLRINHGTDPISHCALGVAGEAGEVADIIKKSQYPNGKLDEAHLREELGDVLWYVTALAGRIGVTLEVLMHLNIAKLEIRQKARGQEGVYDLKALLEADPL